MKRLIIAFGLLFASTALIANDNDQIEFEPVPEPPELPDPLETGENIEPVVTIIKKDDATIEEYRVNGNLYMVKVTPAVGPSYYLVDNNGDGQLNSRRHELDNVVVPTWVLFRW
ncbi:MAG: DUF2782 domain-containing protein [Gammaproteobacteria bacterium]|jgi:hypothetical protein